MSAKAGWAVRIGHHERRGLPLVALLCGLAMMGYITQIVIPHQIVTSQAAHRPRGNLSDLYPRWLGTRELLAHGRNPYSAEVTRDIQLGYYGVALTPDSPIQDQQGFAYPLYVVFLLAPLTLFPFAVVQPIFGWTLLILTALSVPLWLRAIGWSPPRPVVLAAALLAAGSWPALQGWALEQLTLLVAVLLAAACACLAGGSGVGGQGRGVGDEAGVGGWGLGVGDGRGGEIATQSARDPGSKIQNPKSKITRPQSAIRNPHLLAGVLLAVATIKPQVTALLVVGVALWVAGNWRARQGVAWGFLGTMAVLAGGSFLLLPGWLGDFRDALVAYQQYTDGHSLLWIFTTALLERGLPATVEPVTIGLAVALVGLALVVWWRARRAEAGTFPFARAVALTLAITLLIIPTWAPYNQPVLLPAILLLLQYRAALWAAGRRWVRWVWVAAAGIIGWPWLAAGALLLALPFAGGSCCDSAVYRLDVLPLITSPFTPLAVLLALAGLWERGQAGEGVGA